MKVLHLDENFKPCGYDIRYKKFKFPGGETYIKIEDEFKDEVLITQVIRNGDDIIEIALAVDALNRVGIENINLFIPYAPYARQDRVMTQGESLSIKVFANMINNMFFNKVYIFDPHSDVTLALIDRCHVINNHRFVKKMIWDIFRKNPFGKLYLISPDSGANKKIKDLAIHLSDLNLYNIEIVQCDKTRDVKTGNIDGFKVYSDKSDFMDGPCLIVDDICDGGGTFIGLGNQLLNFQPNGLYLAVSHGIFSKGINDLTDHLFDQVFTTNSFYNKNFKNVTTYNLEIEI